MASQNDFIGLIDAGEQEQQPGPDPRQTNTAGLTKCLRVDVVAPYLCLGHPNLVSWGQGLK